MSFSSKFSPTVETPGPMPSYSERSGLVRSQSFGGFLNRNSFIPPSSNTSVLGESFRNVSRPLVRKRSLTLQNPGGFVRTKKNRIKMPKVPRPQRAFLIFDNVKRGLL